MDYSIPKEETPKKPVTVPVKRRSWKRKTLFILLVIFIGMQLYQPDKNNNDVIAANSIISIIPIPDSVNAILRVACYDCHSNNTHYPWYSNIQPGGWWLATHVKEGKQNLNFDEFATYSREKQTDKLTGIKKSQQDDWMPLDSYKWIHADANLKEAQKKLLIDWADSAINQLRVKN